MTEIADTASFLGYALVLFIIAFYLPHVVFKFLAEIRIDLGWRRDATRLEEFVGAALPSVLFNIFAFVLYEALCWLPFLDSYDVDWAVVASIFAADKGALADFIYAGDLARSVGLYFALLYIIAGVNGFLFGYAVHLRLRSDEDPFENLEQITKARADWKLALAVIGLFWSVFYAETLVPFYAWTARETWVVVRTIDDRLYHGLFARYEKSAGGALDFIRLEQVRRYCHDEIEKRYARGRIAVSDFHGALHIKWSQIADINVVEKHRIFTIMNEQYDELKELHRKNNLPPPQAPKGLDLSPDDENEGPEPISGS
jgi:hypothetical protein